ncbi:MAG: biotin/lipoyl-binding protein, partial [Cyclobacteriaceae bacterium]|nr:biotin/lipoyl-binding protein [Cyclobacteriaceae bacterium]
MKNIYLVIILSVAAACSTPSETNSDLEAKKKDLAASQKEFAALREKIAKLEKEIGEADPEFAKQNGNAILVSTFTAEKKPFEHKVEVRGAVESKKNILISAQTMGEIETVKVREGQRVSKGQVLITQNADVIRNSIDELKTALELANSVYEKQANLWE